MEKKAIIIGAGPAGLTAAYELIHRTNIKPVILERSHEIGGISRTVVHNGNRMDIGGHRFFSKSDQVMQWWQNILPVQGFPAKDETAQFISPNENIILSAQPVKSVSRSFSFLPLNCQSLDNVKQ